MAVVTSSTFAYANDWGNIIPWQRPFTILCKNIPVHDCCGDHIHVLIEGTMYARSVIDLYVGRENPQLCVQIFLNEDKVPTGVQLEQLNITMDSRIIAMNGVVKTNWTK